MESNAVIDRLPRHLMNLVIDQPYNSYTPQDHAVWRFVMRQNINYLSKVAHHSYAEGLRMTGIDIDSIPHMYGMNRILKEIGWAAVAVDGFIPPGAFMEFQAYNVLVIAADIRPFDQIEYTPAPDIIHEAAGHAPIIADKEYAEYLRYFGEIGCKAFSSANDYKMYEAIRHLSILKADPYSKAVEVEEAVLLLEELDKNLGAPSEMTRIRNLHWWTVEYGLIGDLDKPKIYGAGLLSSIGESLTSLGPGVRKLPYTIAAADVGFDITTRQPQLFVTPDFPHLTTVLNQFVETMALKRGGVYGMKQAIASENLATAVFSSGLQVTGIFNTLIEYAGEPAFVKSEGPTALCFENKQMEGHDKSYHEHGYSTPVGRFNGISKPPELLSDYDLEEMGISLDSQCMLQFNSGINVTGKLAGKTRIKGRLLLLTFENCSVEYKGRTLFQPGWGTFDMAIGDAIASVYSGAADPDAYGVYFEPPAEKTHKIVHSEKALKLHGLYKQVREMREKNLTNGDLKAIYNILLNEYSDDWLLPMELLELLLRNNQKELATIVQNNLAQRRKHKPELHDLISNGFRMLGLEGESEQST